MSLAKKDSGMYAELTRAIHEKERAELETMASRQTPPVTFAGTMKWISLWGLGIIAWIAVLTGMSLVNISPIIVGLVCAPLGGFAIICLYAIIVLIQSYFRLRKYQRDFLQTRLPAIRNDLAHGQVSVKQVSAQAVIAIVPIEDEGGGFIFDVGDGKLFFLKGQEYESPVTTTMPWPNTDFEIVQTIPGKIWLGIFCSGTKLEPVHEIETSECKDEIVGANQEELVEGDLHQFAATLLKEMK